MSHELDALDHYANQHGAQDDLVTRFCAEFGINHQTAVEIIAWLDAENVTRRQDEAAYTASERRAWQLLVSYQQKQDSVAELRMSTRAMALSRGFLTAADAEGPAELGRKLGIDKQTVTKCLNQFIEKQRLSKLPGQRSDGARARMKQSRVKQLKTA